MVGEDFLPVEIGDGREVEVLHLGVAAALDGEKVLVAEGEAADLVDAVAVALVDQAGLDAVDSAGHGDLLVGERGDFFPSGAFAPVDHEHGAVPGVGAEGPFHGRGLDVDQQADEHGDDRALAALEIGLAEVEDVLLLQRAGLMAEGLPKALVDEGAELVHVPLGRDPLDGELAPGDEVRVQVGNVHGPHSGRGLGVCGAPLAAEHGGVFRGVVDPAAHLALVVGALLDDGEVGLLRQVLELGAGEADALPLQRLEMPAVGARDEELLLGAAFEALPGLAGLEDRRGEADELGIPRSLHAALGQFAGVPLPLDHRVGVPFVQDGDAELLVPEGPAGVRPHEVDDHALEEIGEVRQVV